MSITEEFQKRAAEKPDKWTLAWWNEQFQEVLQGYRGATHAMNRALADNEDLGKEVTVLQEQVKTMEADRELDRAKIGKLQARLEGLVEGLQLVTTRLDRQGEFLTTLKQKK